MPGMEENQDSYIAVIICYNTDRFRLSASRIFDQEKQQILFLRK